MSMLIESIIKSEKFLKPMNANSSNMHLLVNSKYLCDKYNIKNEEIIDAKILSVHGIKDYLDTPDLNDFNNIDIKMYILPAGCGPNDGLFFDNSIIKLFDKHSIIKDKYIFKIEIDKINNNEIEGNIKINE